MKLVMSMMLAVSGGDAAAASLTPSLTMEREAALAEAREQLDAMRKQQRLLQADIPRLEASIARLEAEAPPPGKRTHASGVGKIVNGVATWSYPTTGALLRGADAAGADAQCSGTLVGPRSFLTAAHCFGDSEDPAEYHVFLQHGGLFGVKSITLHPDYRFPHADLAVLRLDRPAHGIAPTAVRTTPVPLGAPGDIIGFGRAGGSKHDYGIKRAGRVQVGTCDRPESSLLCWDFDAEPGAPGEDSNTCEADSGGPLYIQPDGQDAPLVLAGVTSGGSRADCLGGDHSFDVDVQQFAAWIAETAAEPLGQAAADDALPPWGSERVYSPSAQLQFDATVREARLNLPVPPGATLLRVALNGHDEGARDFDLLVVPVDGAAVAACVQDGNGQFAFCEFAAPPAGDWTVDVRAKHGNGIAQVTATVYEP